MSSLRPSRRKNETDSSFYWKLNLCGRCSLPCARLNRRHIIHTICLNQLIIKEVWSFIPMLQTWNLSFREALPVAQGCTREIQTQGSLPSQPRPFHDIAHTAKLRDLTDLGVPGCQRKSESNHQLWSLPAAKISIAQNVTLRILHQLYLCQALLLKTQFCLVSYPASLISILLTTSPWGVTDWIRRN